MKVSFQTSLKVFLLSVAVLTGQQEYDSWHMGMVARMPYPSCSDVWGYTDENGHDFAVFGISEGTVIVDVSTNPSEPVETGLISGAYSGWRDLKTHGDYLYVTNETGGGLDIIDLTDPWNPTLAKRYSGFTTAHNLFIADGFAYIVGSDVGSGGIRILDLQDPLYPEEVGSWETTYIHDIYVKNDTAYACGIFNGDLHILDVSDKSDIQTLAVLDYDDYGTHQVWTTEDSRYIITADEFNGGHVKIWDAADFSNITLVGEYQVGENKSVHNVFVRGDKLFVSYYVFGTRVVDISNPADPQEVAYFDFYPGSSGIYSGNWGVYPFTASGLIYSTSMSGQGFFILQYPLYVEFSHEPHGDTEDSVGTYAVTVIMEAADENQLVPGTAIVVSGLNASFTDTTTLVAGDNPGEFVGEIPGYGEAGALTYYFAVLDTADRWSTSPYGAPGSYYSFNVGPDTIPPVIHSVSETGNQFGRSGKVSVTASISDNISVAQAYLDYTVSGVDPGTVQTASMSLVGNQWQGEITWNQVPWHTVITYEVRAIDSTSRRNVTVSEPGSFQILNWTALGNWEAKDLSGWDTGDGWGFSGFGKVGTVVNDSPNKTYQNNANNILARIEPVDVGSYSTAYMEFWHLSLLETDRDSGYVEVSTDGSRWTAVSTVTGLGVQRDERIDLSSYLDTGELWVRFRMTSDEENVYGGWFIDDVLFLVDTVFQTISADPARDTGPARFSLEGNYPNPFNATTTLVYHLPVAGDIRILIYDLMGREVARLEEGRREAGRHQILWNAGALSSGVYVYRITAESNGKTLFDASRKMVLLK
ncbi:MAG: choice-of-anchor B family protein [Fidelibacterota bacterium]